VVPVVVVLVPTVVVPTVVLIPPVLVSTAVVVPPAVVIVPPAVVIVPPAVVVVPPAVVIVPTPVPTIVVVRGVRGYALLGGAGSSSTTQHHGDCRAERGSKAGNAHNCLLSQQTHGAPARIGQGNRRPQSCAGSHGAPVKTLDVLECSGPRNRGV
jgi:hypothetical protein